MHTHGFCCCVFIEKLQANCVAVTPGTKNNDLNNGCAEKIKEEHSRQGVDDPNGEPKGLCLRSGKREWQKRARTTLKLIPLYTTMQL